MIINLQKFLRLPVYTESGTKLGKIVDFEMDVDSQTVVRYYVRPVLFSVKSFLIQNSQIKEIKDDKIVVYDSVVFDYQGKTSGMALEE